MGSHPTESLCTFIYPKRGTVQTPEAFRPHGSTERTRNHTAANRTCAWSTLKRSQGIPNECHQLDLINKPCQPGRSCEFVLTSTSRHTHRHQAWVHHAQGHHLPSGSQRPLKVSPGIFTGNTVCKFLELLGFLSPCQNSLPSRGGCAGVTQVKNNVVLTIFNAWGKKKQTTYSYPLTVCTGSRISSSFWRCMLAWKPV